MDANTPKPLSEQGDITRNWIQWKREFMTFMEANNYKKLSNELQAYMLRNYIGKFGQDIIEKVVVNNKERDNIDVLLEKLDKYFEPPKVKVNPPSDLSDSGDVAKNWIKWKQDFQKFMQTKNMQNKPKNLHAIMLTSYIGKFGQSILNSIVTDAKDQNDIDVLLRRLDVYFESCKGEGVKYLPPPGPLSNNGDMAQNWLKWKNDFMTYLKATNAISKPNVFQAYSLRKCIGKFGQDTIEKVVTDSKEKHDINTLLQRLDKYFDSSKNEGDRYLPLPGPLSNNGDVLQNWMKWKKDFLLCMTTRGSVNKNYQAYLLKNCIGKFGQDIIDKIVTDSKERDDINILLQKLDEHFNSSKNNVNIQLPSPDPLSDNGDVAQNWRKWKKDFMIYLKATNASSEPNDIQAYLLRSCIGKFGEDIIEKIITDSEERNNINILLEKLDKHFNSSKNNVNVQLPPPAPLSNNGDVAQNWRKWKKDLMIYLKATNATSQPNNVQAYLLRSSIGKFGEDIIEKVVTDSKERDDINILLQKLDKHFNPSKNEVLQRYNFFSSVRKPNTSVEDYILELKAKAATCNFGKLTDSLIRDKIIVDLYDRQLRDKLLSEENLNLLKLRSIYSEHMSQNPNRTTSNDNTTSNELKNPNQYRRNCRKCDKRHALKACPAYGTKCEKCGTYNHFTSCCPHNFTNNENSRPNVTAETAQSHHTNWGNPRPTAPSPFDFENTLYPREHPEWRRM